MSTSEPWESWRTDLEVYVNGKRARVAQWAPDTTLLEFLRSHSRLQGTKLGCGEGGCGACTVMLSRFDHERQSIEHLSVNACLFPLYAADSCAVTTVEGIGNLRKGLHPVQERLARAHGSQCGFCTPGFVMALYTLLHQNPDITSAEVEEHLDGNLCRCTGYRPILDAAKTFASDNAACCGGGGGGGGCCGGAQAFADRSGAESYDPAVADGFANVAAGERVTVCTEKRGEESIFRKNYRELGIAEPIFPPALQLSVPSALAVETGGVHWFRPTTLPDLLRIKAAFPEATLVCGNTELGVDLKFRGRRPGAYIHVAMVAPLHSLAIRDGSMHLGPAASLGKVASFLDSICEDAEADGRETAAAFRDQLRWFASTHIRSVACLGGNLATASPISDMNPLLLAADAVLELASEADGSREVPMRDFFTGYRQTALEAHEIIADIRVPLARKHEIFVPYKQARRREDDISIVTGGIRLRFEACREGWVVREARMGFGGVAATTRGAPETEALLSGKVWDRRVVADAMRCLTEELRLEEPVPGGQAAFRTALPPSFLFKFFIRSCDLLNAWAAAGNLAVPLLELAAAEHSAHRSFLREAKPPSRGEHSFIIESGGLHAAQPVPHGPPAAHANAERAPVGQPIMHQSALAQVAGEARYVDDIPAPADALHAALVLSTKAHARLVNVDPGPALALDGVEGYFGAADVPGSNAIGPVVKDEECFASEKVHCLGQVIGLIVATSAKLARRAAELVAVEYEELEPILDIADAIAAKSYLAEVHRIDHGDLAAAEATTTPTGEGAIVEGEMHVGGQEHFYLETNATLVLPQENGGLEIFASTQNCTKTQNFAAHVCGVDASKVVARTKRMGGAFGGKETRSVFVSCAAAVAATHLQRPVRIMLDRDTDMQTTGQRHAFFAKYRAGATAEGTLAFLDVKLYSNAGCSLDLSAAVMDRALFHLDNAYDWGAVRAEGFLCRTNMPSHTAFRGFGGPQGMLVCEAIVDHLARRLGLEPGDVRHANLYKGDAATHYGQRLPGPTWHVPRMVEELLERSDYAARLAAVNDFNAANRYRKRGLSWVPTKFGINFTAKFMNQGGALVHVYTDGTVLVTHGGTEMGQGLHTKMAAVAAQAFGIPAHLVHVAETASDKVANASPTAASMSTDLYGMAVLDACEQILAQLEPLRDPGLGWASLVQKAYFSRVNLSAQGFYAVPGDRCGYDWHLPVGSDNARRGMPFNYFTQGVAASEVEIDCLTGDASVVRSDVLMDLGQSVNPALDVGQIEGAFVQGLGWLTTEEVIWGDASHPWVAPGRLFSRGPGAYKIPAANDVPRDFRVHLLSDAPNPFAVHSSKAVGEPPYFTAASAFFAIKEAMRSARRDERGVDEPFVLNAPATSERIRMGCLDMILQGVGWGAENQPKGSC